MAYVTITETTGTLDTFDRVRALLPDHHAQVVEDPVPPPLTRISLDGAALWGEMACSSTG